MLDGYVVHAGDATVLKPVNVLTYLVFGLASVVGKMTTEEE